MPRHASPHHYTWRAKLCISGPVTQPMSARFPSLDSDVVCNCILGYIFSEEFDLEKFAPVRVTFESHSKSLDSGGFNIH